MSDIILAVILSFCGGLSAGMFISARIIDSNDELNSDQLSRLKKFDAATSELVRARNSLDQWLNSGGIADHEKVFYLTMEIRAAIDDIVALGGGTITK